MSENIIKDYPWEFRKVSDSRVEVYDMVNPAITYLGSVEIKDGSVVANVHHDNPWGKLPMKECLKLLNYGLGV